MNCQCCFWLLQYFCIGKETERFLKLNPESYILTEYYVAIGQVGLFLSHLYYVKQDKSKPGVVCVAIMGIQSSQ